jgi:signal peptidase I
MYPAIEAGDYILVNKQIPGPRVYRDMSNIAPNGKIETKRYSGFRPIRRNDIIVFNFPYTDWGKVEMNTEVNYVKRCVAIPGDTFAIENGIYKVLNSPDEILGNRENQGTFSADINRGKSIVFPYDTVNYRWTRKNFGPLYIPKKNVKIAIDTINYVLYSKIITYETNSVVSVQNGSVCLGDSVIHDYTFLQNYYFMAGDYVFDSVDSRYWGLVPEDHIIGKAFIVWRAADMETRQIRWKRFFKFLN